LRWGKRVERWTRGGELRRREEEWMGEICNNPPSPLKEERRRGESGELLIKC